VVICSIDPGVGGAIVFISQDGHLIDVADMPFIEVRGKKRVSAAELSEVIRKRMPALVVIEGVGAMGAHKEGRKQGLGSAFVFGYSAGLLEGVAAGLGISVAIIQASVWKPKAGVSKDKGIAREMAIRLWPGAADKFKRVKDDGRAEAALLGRWYATTKGMTA